MNITIFLTRNCNLECTYCYEGEKCKDSMSIETADNAINFIDERIKKDPILKDRILNIVLYGGEPLLNHKVLDYIIDNLKRKNEYDINFDMTTNGTIMNSEIIKTLKKIHSVSVSIDGGIEIHNENRVFKDKQGTFDIVKKNIDKMISEGINIRARGTYTPETCKYLYDSVNNISDFGVGCIVMHPNMYDKTWSDEDFDTIFSEIKKISNDKDLNEKCKHISLVDISNFAYESGSCFGGIADFAIDCNGDIYPCSKAVGTEEFLIGNVNKKIIEENKVKELFKLNIDNDVCNGCSRIKYCKGNKCKILNKIDTGEFFIPNGINCKFQQLEIRKYRYVKELENRNVIFK